MNQPNPIGEQAKVIGLQERRLGRTVLRTYRTKMDIANIVPNERQPRLGPKEDDELQRQIEANEGLFEPLLVEPHPDLPGKFRIIDGDRRWTNSMALVAKGKDQYRQVPVEVTDRTLSDDERLRVWIYIHRQRKEWDAKEKEMVAYRLVDLVGRASAANILGLTVRELDKLVEVFELSERFKSLREPGSAITWARELMGVSKKLLAPTVVDAVVKKVNQKRITNSKDLRKLRAILRDPVAKQHFLSDEGDLESAILRVTETSAEKAVKPGPTNELDAAMEAMKRVPWNQFERFVTAMHRLADQDADPSSGASSLGTPHVEGAARVTFSAGTPVRSIDNPSREGVITNTPARRKPSGLYFQVRWADGTVDFLHGDELEPLADLDQRDPFDLAAKGRYGRASDLRRNLTYVHLSGRLANLVYAMGITATDFYAHQYRPLLALLDSPTNGLLIADEVGLGKTIEAGLIWTELRARFDMRRLVVVCPALLREKWRDELRNRFGVDAQIVDAASLHDALSQPGQQLGEGRAWITSYHAARPPRSWRANTKPATTRPGQRWLLADFLRDHAEDEPLIDMVVFDEAHYMRNSETSAWQLAELLRDVSSYQLMLSATPINLHNRDLFNLLNLLDPEHFAAEADFARLIEANRPLVAARDAALNRSTNAAKVIAHLREAAAQPILSKSLQLAEVLKDPPDDLRLSDKRYRAELADTLERINLLSHVVTRTRKRDLGGRIRREVKRESVPMSDAERTLYQTVTDATREFALRRGISDGFLLASPQRQVTSCPAAVVKAWLGDEKGLNELADDLEDEYADELEDDEEPLSLRETLRQIVPKSVDLAELQRVDSKFTRLMEVAGRFLQDHPSEKIVVFTTFRATARYLVERLNAEGLPARIIWGNQAETKQEVIDEFRESPTLRVLVSTEVASEGVDLQFCRVVVNYDLPWNPTRIEQRIGRIDRLGQSAELIHVWNLYFEGTIDERVVSRLFERLRIFEEALGEAEPIVGEAVRKLESALLSRPLTKEEEDQQIDQAAQALQNLRLQREALERNAAHLMAHGQRVIERIEAAQELARRVTDNDLHVYVKDYLAKYWPGHRFAQEGADWRVISMQLPGEFAARLDDFLRVEGLLGKTLLASGEVRTCRFLNRISEHAKRGEEIIHQFHPLIRFISRDLKSRNEHFYPLVALAVRTDRASALVPKGKYAFYARSWVFRGVRDEEVLAVAALALDSGVTLDEDAADQLLHVARLEGQDWLGVDRDIDAALVQQRFEEAESILDDRYRIALQRKRNENADRAQFQIDSIEQYLNRRLPKLRETLQTHLTLGRAGIAKATQGQIDKLTARMNTRRERIKEQERVVADRHFVCAGVLSVQ